MFSYHHEFLFVINLWFSISLILAPQTLQLQYLTTLALRKKAFAFLTHANWNAPQ